MVRIDQAARRDLTSPNPLKQTESRRAVEMSQSRTDPFPQCLIGRATTRQGGGGTPSSQESRVRLPRASEARGSRRFHGRGCLQGSRRGSGLLGGHSRGWLLLGLRYSYGAESDDAARRYRSGLPLEPSVLHFSPSGRVFLRCLAPERNGFAVQAGLPPPPWFVIGSGWERTGNNSSAVKRPGSGGGSGYWISTRGWSVRFVA